jgi:2-dehydropantoate 2-reductase
MKIVIVGGGAIGRLFGASLVKGNNDVTIVDTNPKIVEEIQKQGISVASTAVDPSVATGRVPVTAVGDAGLIDRCDLVLLLVKSFATRSAAKSVAHLVSPESPVIFMQTGLGNQAILREMFSAKSILAGITFMSGTAFGNSAVRQGRWGLTFIGELGGVGELTGDITPRLKKICKTFCDSGIETRWSHQIICRLWTKVITYSVLNTLSTVFKVPNGRLLENDECIRLVKQLLAEGEAVAKARGVETLSDDLYELFKEVVKVSSNNLSSMLQDILNDRPTEIEAQSGAIVRYAEKYGVNVPGHQMMTSIIRLFEIWPMER